MLCVKSWRTFGNPWMHTCSRPELWLVDSQPEAWATGWTLVRGVLQMDEVS